MRLPFWLRQSSRGHTALIYGSAVPESFATFRGSVLGSESTAGRSTRRREWKTPVAQHPSQRSREGGRRDTPLLERAGQRQHSLVQLIDSTRRHARDQPAGSQNPEGGACNPGRFRSPPIRPLVHALHACDARCVAMAKCGATTADGKKCKNPVRQGERWCYRHPGGRSSYRPPARSVHSRSDPTRHQQPQRASSRPVRATTRSTAPSQRSIARRAKRLIERAERHAPQLDGKWCGAVLDHLDAAAQGDLSIRNCRGFAAAAVRILRERHPPRYRREGARGFLVELFGGPSAEDSIAAAIADQLPLDEQQSAIAAARALQALGIALCRRAGRAPQRCPCFIDPATDETADVLALIIRAAVGDWTGLVIPFAPLASA